MGRYYCSNTRKFYAQIYAQIYAFPRLPFHIKYITHDPQPRCCKFNPRQPKTATASCQQLPQSTSAVAIPTRPQTLEQLPSRLPICSYSAYPHFAPPAMARRRKDRLQEMTTAASRAAKGDLILGERGREAA
jgi:hypothetical protein